MAKLLAATALGILHHSEIVLFFLLGKIIVFVVLFRLVLGIFAPRLIFASLSATPPHFSTEFISMGPARPVEILLV